MYTKVDVKAETTHPFDRPKYSISLQALSSAARKGSLDKDMNYASGMPEILLFIRYRCMQAGLLGPSSHRFTNKLRIRWHGHVLVYDLSLILVGAIDVVSAELVRRAPVTDIHITEGRVDRLIGSGKKLATNVVRRQGGGSGSCSGSRGAKKLVGPTDVALGG